ncbi:SDR family oxidoreductase [Dactylosporangium vinaceum]|uniref:SDR family oxidoreductase n=1 Tax=Dactylosporangium vinaceum TaxID=53362 RepID=A0ABV5MKK6_9ACTN|nr:SDR family oxidoreductase [Dactylosporangium vinaceum]
MAARSGRMILDAFRLDGRTALVTGASRGIGRGFATALAAAGADVVGLGRTAPPGAARFIECDLATAGPATLAAAVESLDRLDILVNNAGIIRRSPAAGMSAADWDEVLTVNLDAVFHLSRAAGRRMLTAGGGRIVNVASMLSFQGGLGVASYAASKHAVVGLTRALANEWAGRGVNVNAIAPGYIETDNTAPLRADPARFAAISDRIPAGRWGTPDDLAGALVFLCSDAARYVHGTVLPVDGGWLGR